MDTVTNDTDLNRRLLAEQIKVLYQIFWPLLAGTLSCALAVVYALWVVTSHTSLLIWLSLLLITYGLRIALYFFYQTHFTTDNAQRYGMMYALGSGVAGSIWGIGSVIILPPDLLDYQLFVFFLLVTQGATTVSSMSCYKPAFYAYMPISIIPLGMFFTLQAQPLHQAIGYLTIPYVIALSYFATKFNHSFVDSLKLRFENLELVAQLREQKMEADSANRAKSKFLAAASHDLRQPLHALTLFTSVLDESIKYPVVRRVVEQIKSSVSALQNLFNALLDVSQLDAGVMKVEKVYFYLTPVFNKLANDFNSQASKKGLRLHWPDCDYAVYTDPSLFEQILRNFVSNAINYTETGEITIDCIANGEVIDIHVIDTGPGITDVDQEAIFSEFYQLNNPERDRSKGLGLGLAIVKRTANLLSHSIKVESQPGSGSTFSITVEQAHVAVPVDVNGTEPEINFRPITNSLIIVIDDEISVREGMQSLLQLWGCEVITAVDQAEAITLLRQHGQTPDGIIADYRLRENKTGVEAIHAIHAEFHDGIPALIVTGDIAVERLREVKNSGFQMLHKPVAPAKLRAFVHNTQRQAMTEPVLTDSA